MKEKGEQTLKLERLCPGFQVHVENFFLMYENQFSFLLKGVTTIQRYICKVYGDICIERVLDDLMFITHRALCL